MCCGEYPKIEKRDEHLHAACAKFSVLNAMLTSMLSYQPNDRPSSQQISVKLGTIMENDRYYSPGRRLLPLSDIGVLGYRWLCSEVDVRTKDAKLALDQNTRRLLAEEQRYKTESQRLDFAKHSILSLEQECSSKQLEIGNLHSKIDMVQQLLEATLAEKAQLGELLKFKETENLSLKQVCNETGQIVEHQKHLLHGLEMKRIENARSVENYLHDISALRHQYDNSTIRGNELEVQLKEAQDYIVEVESRLEQVLVRWQLEKEGTLNETKRCDNLRKHVEELKHKLLEQQIEMETLTCRLKMYDNLPMPEEIKIRMQDMENDALKFKAQRDEKQIFINELQAKLSDHANNLEDCYRKINDCNADIVNQKAIIEQFHAKEISAIEQLQDVNAKLEQAMIKREEDNNTIETLLAKVAQLQDSCADWEEKYLWEKRMRLDNDGKRHGTIDKVAAEQNVANESPQEVEIGEQIHTDLTESVNASNSNVSESLPSPAVPYSSIRASTADAFYNFEVSSAIEHKKKSNIDYILNRESELETNKDNSAKTKVELTIENHGAEGLYEVICHEYCKGNPYIIWRSVRAIREFVIKDEKFQEFCCNNRFDIVIVNAMQEFKSNSIVQAQCLRLLAALAYGNDKMRRYLGEQGIITLVLKIIDTFISNGNDENDALQLHACTLLTNLFHNSLENRNRL